MPQNDLDYSQYYWQTARLRLRRFAREDIERSVAFDYQSYDRYLWDGEVETPPDEQARRKRWEDRLAEPQDKQRPMLVIETRAGEYIGLLNVHTYNPRSGTFGFGIYILPAQRGKGYATEALRRAANYMFRECRMHKWASGYVQENEASAALHRRLGHVIEGVIRDSVYHAGKYQNDVLCGVLHDEFYAIRENWEGYI